MNSALPMLPVLICLGPAMALIGFVLVMVGLASRQPKMWKWGLAILITGALVLAIYLVVGASRPR
jgi:NADH:ubiquinone oxidoreductase subunit 6 (subunit J)